MKPRLQNIAVGITVLVALLILAGLVVMFTGLPQMFQSGYEIKILFPTNNNAKTGDPVYLMGMEVGRVTSIEFTDPNDVTKGVTFVARINGNVRLPGNVQARMFTRVISGAPYIALLAEGPLRKDPTTGREIDFLPTEPTIVIEGTHQSEASSIIPPEVSDAMVDLAGLAKKADKLIDDLGPAMKSFGKLADNLNAMLTDEEAPPPGTTTQPGEPAPAPAKPTVQQNFKAALANFAKASAEATEALKALREFSTEAKAAVSTISKQSEDLIQKLIVDAEKLSRVLSSFEKAMANVEQGKGTAGKLIYDTELYNSLVEASKTMTQTLQEVQDLLKQWKAQGVGIKMK